jgi:hypothetical protein
MKNIQKLPPQRPSPMPSPTAAVPLCSRVPRPTPYPYLKPHKRTKYCAIRPLKCCKNQINEGQKMTKITTLFGLQGLKIFRTH